MYYIICDKSILFYFFTIGLFLGILVVFGRPHSSRRMSTRLDSPTPRSMSALGGSLGGPSALAFSHIYNPPTTDVSRSLSSFYFQEPVKVT